MERNEVNLNYEMYYYLPWPDCQALIEDCSIEDKLMVPLNDNGILVEKDWFNKMHTVYGL